MNSCSSCAVRESAICQSLTNDKLDELSRHGRRQKIGRGQTLMWEGDESLLVGNVVDGVFKLSNSTWDGRNQTIGFAFSSDFVGRPFGPKSYQSVTALTDAEICTFMRSDFDSFAHLHPSLERKLLERTLMDLDHARHWILLLGRKSASERVATFLLEMASRLSDEADDDEEFALARFELPFGRQEIADLLGLTIETVSRQITKLHRNGAIEASHKRKIVILDRAKLEDCAGL